MVCKECGKKIKDGVDECPRCGAQQTPDTEPKMVSLGAIKASQDRKRPPLSKKQKITRIVVIVVAALLALLIAVGSILYAYMVGRVDRVSDLSGDMGINSELPTNGVQNIALFGLDTRTNNDSGRSDSMIILSIDRTHNKIKMTSLARDSLVAVEGHGRMKLTEAWAYGKANLAIKTINQNFGMNITDYVYVNFFEFADIIDYVGGVNIDVSAAEKQVMNTHYVSWIQRYGIDCPRVTQTGMQRLNGGQALAYSRNRYTGSDVERGGRQREVLTALYDEVKTLSWTKFPSLISKVLGMCHTNLTNGELLSIASWALTKQPTIENFSLPDEECDAWGGTTSPYGWVWIYDMNVATAVLHDFIYETSTDMDSVSAQVTDPIAKKTKKKTTTTTTTTTKGSTTTTTTTTTQASETSSTNVTETTSAVSEESTTDTVTTTTTNQDNPQDPLDPLG